MNKYARKLSRILLYWNPWNPWNSHTERIPPATL